MNALRVVSATLLSGLLAATVGCSSTSPQPASDNAGVYGGAGSASTASDTKPSYSNIYFDYRQSALDSADTAILEGWAAYFKANPNAKAALEGHGDERGSEATNLALGENRAASVRAYLTLAGVPGAQLSIKSHGKSRPAAMGHDEAAWSQNRRVEIVLR